MANERPSGGAAIFWLTLAFAVALATWASLPPPPRTAVGPGEFALGRALTDLREITRAPRPVGSAENARVRDVLVARLRGMGLATDIQQGTAVRQSPRGSHPIGIAPVANIVAVLPGRDSTQPAVAVMAHYDSVPFSYGASDDGAGTVAVLETARALVAGPQPQRDVVFLLTDGEEPGLLGAQMFFDDHPLARRIGVVVNAEARGSKGRASMFQTSPGDAELVDLWANHAVSPTGNSVSSTIYRMLPNDTDLSVSLLKGVAGINGSFIGGHFDYHSTTDSYATIDRGSLQHLGDFTLTTTRALAMAERLPTAARGDAVFFDVLGLFVVRYPPWLGWVPLVLAAAGLIWLYASEKGLSWQRGLGGFAGAAAATIAVLAAGEGIGMAMMGGGSAQMREVMAEIDLSIWAMAALVLAAALLLRPARALRLGALVLLLAAGIAAQIRLPGAAFLFAWPVLIGTGLMLVERHPLAQRPAAKFALAAVAALVLAVALQLLGFAYIGIGMMIAGIMGLALPLLIALLPSAPGHARPAGIAILAVALGIIGWTAIDDGFSPRHPQPGDVFALYGGDDGKAWWATTSGSDYLPEGPTRSFSYEPFVRDWFTVTEARGIAAPSIDSRLTIGERTIGARRQWDIAITRPPRHVTLAFKPDRPLADVRVNGRAVTMEADEWTHISYRAPRPFAIQVSAAAPAGARVRIRYMVATPGLPPSPPRDPAPVTNWTYFSGTEMIMGEWAAPR